MVVKPEDEGQADVGIVGIGVMGRNLALNILDRGFTLAIWNYETEWSEAFLKEHRPKYGDNKVFAGKTYEDFAKLLKKPRKALILVTAGKATDMVIENLGKVFEAGDIIVDTGNAHFKDQSGRAEMLEAKGLRFLGMGISGGAEGARKGPAFFPGGTMSVWAEVQPIVEAASAKASDGRPCVTMCGKGGAGSCVKMYHNAGEYAILQIWGEIYAAMRSAGMASDEIKAKLLEWKARGDLDSYMLDITIEVAGHKSEEAASGFLVDVTADTIGSKGTGLWSVQVAMEVGCPVPSLAAAVVARQMSMVQPQRKDNAAIIGEGAQRPCSDSGMAVAEKDKICEDLYWAAYLSSVASYAQMFESIRAVDREYQLEIIGNLPRIISTFRAGCILQGAMLEPMTNAFEENPNIPNLICAFTSQIDSGMAGFRACCARAALNGEPLPVIQASLGYLAAMSRTVLVAAQVVSLQRDVFGRHGFKKLKDGEVTAEAFNENWPDMVP